jgi:hypothetical protein
MESSNKGGFTVKEIEAFTKKYRFQIFFILGFFLAMIFGYVFLKILTLPMGAIGGILGVAFPLKVEQIARRVFQFVFGQDSNIQMILGIVYLILSIFLPFLIFFIMGLHGGKNMHHMAREMQGGGHSRRD